MKDLFYILIIILLLWLFNGNNFLQGDQVLDVAESGCGRIENVQWIQVGIGGWGFGCYEFEDN